MIVSFEAKSTVAFFNMLKKLELMDASEDFDIFYVFMKRVEYYADQHKSSRVE